MQTKLDNLFISRRNVPKDMKRNPVFDIMKGITILLVILGHETWLPELPKNAIFAFHMPLFFLVSGYFFKQFNLQKDIKRLIVPYLFTGLLLLFFHLLRNVPSFDLLEVKRDILNIFWGSGSCHSARLWGDKPQIGAIWFLLALFWCRMVYGILKSRIGNEILRLIIVLIISLSAILLDRYVISLPFTILPGCAAVVFFWLGDNMKKGMPGIVAAFCVICFVLSFVLQPRICLVNCHYRIYPLTVAGAVGGTLALYYLSGLLSRWNFSRNVLSWCGRMSLAILCFHLFQLNTDLLKPGSGTISIISAFCFPIIAALFCSKVKVMRSLFGIIQ